MIIKNKITFFEIFILVMATVAFSFLVGQSNDVIVSNSQHGESYVIKKARSLFIAYFGKNLVSAEEILWTCPVDKQGSLCQEYSFDTCNEKCSVSCFPGPRDSFNQCQLGTCYDSKEGTCGANTPRAVCEKDGGTWDVRSQSEIPACRLGCCLIGDQALYQTEQACNVIRTRTSQEAEFRPVANELACLALANSKQEGACLLEETEPGLRACKFVQKESCISLGGDFYPNILCSNVELKTTCQKQAKTGCVDNRDEVYWFDSCGNRENIYSANKAQSWNNGKVLEKGSSCEIRYDSNGKVINQASCGNCDYLLGSVCGTKRANDVQPSIGNYVCRDLSCTDTFDENKKHKNGESWCVYESQIGNQGSGNSERSSDVPGSQHYRASCLNGEVSIESCGDFRNGICSEARDEKAKFSSAACRVNQWQQCLEINTRYADSAKNGEPPNTDILNECNQISDCYLKDVDVASKFKFRLCVPKYPPGFDLSASDGELSGGDVAGSVCGFATQTCTYVKTKKLFGSSKTNAECRDEKFTNTMNNLCMSLGDCGAKVNIVGEYTDGGYEVKNAPELSDAYKEALKILSSPKAGQHADPLSEEETAALFGINEADPQIRQSKMGEMLGYLGAGATGINLIDIALGSGAGFEATLGSIGGSGVPETVYTSALGPEFGAFANGAAGLAAGAAIGFLVGKLFGLTGDALLITVVLGAVGGLLAVTGFFGAGSGVFGAVALFSMAFLVWAAVFALIGVAIVKILGIGDSKKTKVEFQCLPWEAPLGGVSCDKCGDNGLPCTKYKCQSLGQACKYVEDAADDKCVNAGANDVSAPIISPNNKELLQGYSYSLSQSELGFVLKGGEANSCVPVFTQIKMGITTNELSRCKVSDVREDYDEMSNYFHSFNGLSSSSFRLNHTMIFSISSKESFDKEDELAKQFADGEVFDKELLRPDANGRVNLFVKCTDVNGNKNEGEYSINFCVSPEPDKTAPLITSFSPMSPSYSALDSTNKNIKFYTNEPAECKWSTQDKAYDLMENTATCTEGLADGTFLGWPCEANLAVEKDSAEQTFYFRCKDQPLKAENERNVNSESTPYLVKKTTNPLQIVSLSPDKTKFFTNGLPFLVNLSVVTKGGAEGTKRYCEFTWGGKPIQFFETGTDEHKQPKIAIFLAADYSVPIKCYDEAGNQATGTIEFSVDIDSQGPFITRVYNQNGLNVITNEKSTCTYNLNSCSFNAMNATLMLGNELVHTASFTSDLTHYVICRDTFGNVGSCVAVQAGKI